MQLKAGGSSGPVEDMITVMSKRNIGLSMALLAMALAYMAGCASGSALIVGEARPAIEDWSSLVLLMEMPEGAEQIAIVKASSDAGINQQKSLDYAVDELKKQAAKVGANTVVLTGRDTSSQTVGVPVYGGGTIVTSSEVEVVQGIAVWVD
jgi:hypothetical protein